MGACVAANLTSPVLGRRKEVRPAVQDVGRTPDPDTVLVTLRQVRAVIDLLNDSDGATSAVLAQPRIARDALIVRVVDDVFLIGPAGEVSTAAEVMSWDTGDGS